MPEEYKSANEIAKNLGRNPDVIRRMCAQYGIDRTPKGYPTGAVMRALQEAAKKDNRAPLPDGDPRKRKVELENRLLEIKIAESEGKLIDAEQVEQEAQRVGAAIKNDILALPQSLAGRLAGQTEPARIADILDSSLRDCLRHLSDEVGK